MHEEEHEEETSARAGDSSKWNFYIITGYRYGRESKDLKDVHYEDMLQANKTQYSLKDYSSSS